MRIIQCAVVLSALFLAGRGHRAASQATSADGKAASQLQQITTTPARLVSGSPFLLTVKLPAGATSVKGSWSGHELSFFKAHNSASRGEPLWLALAGVDVETVPGEYPLTVAAAAPNGKTLRIARQIQIGAAHYRTSALKVEGNFIEPNAATQKEIVADKLVKDRIFADTAPLPGWSGDFTKPVPAEATDSFGTRRTFNGKLASIHRGMDFRAPSGTPVVAANSGKIVLARKLFYEGNCVVIDHGQGFMTLYMHLSQFVVHEGAVVQRGQRLGLSGATGRVTGPHLHFAARWQGAYIDPAALFRLDLTGKP